MDKFYKIEPILEERVWGGQKIREQFGYQTDLNNIAEVYHVIAIPGHLDNMVSGTGESLSAFYKSRRDLFDCGCEELPVRMVSACAADKLSLHMHPYDDYALEHEGMRGKIEGGFTLNESDKEYEMILGHNAGTLEEFKSMVYSKDWEHLFRHVKVRFGDYIHMPIGTLHGEGGDGTEIMVAFSTNGDVTYRLYDYDRNDPKRPLHIEKIFDNVTVPDHTVTSKRVRPYLKNGCLTYDYYSKEKEYTGRRIKTSGKASFEMDEFMFLLCVGGKASINGHPVKAGETLFVPAHSGSLSIDGTSDLCVLSYLD